MGVINPEEIKHQMYSTKVMEIVEETRVITSTNENWSEATGEFTGQTDTESAGGAIYDGAQQDSRLWNQSKANSGGTSKINARGGGTSKTEVPFVRQIMGKEESSREFRSMDEQWFRAMASLFDQKQRHGVTRLVGMRAPVNIVTPTVTRKPTSKEMTNSFLTRVYEKLPFALKSADAHKQIEVRQQKIISGSTHKAETEEIPVRRKIQ